MRYLPSALLALTLGAGLAGADEVTGTVTYLQRMLLPPDSVVEIQLLDVSRADAPSTEIATYSIKQPGPPPYSFTLDYDPEAIDGTATYVVRATVRDNGRLIMTTDTAYPVLTRGAGNVVEMVMKGVEQSDGAPGSKPDVDLVNTYWKILTLKGQSISVAENQKEPHLILRMDGSYNATAGCNMIRGGYSIAGTGLSFSPGPSTLMACIKPLDAYEAALGQVLLEAEGFRIAGETMELLDTTGEPLATFRAVYF